ncbi:MAG TPA: hypothetical protein DDW27_02095 [Bacteroidales bacterium]|nr:hypothetical protein [Bacteroidales bacterium]
MATEVLMNSLRIRSHILTLLLFLVPLTVIPQKVNILIVKTRDAGVSEWKILDGQYRPVISEKDFYDNDSVLFSLEAGNRYLLEVSVSDISNPDTTLCSLSLNGEPIVLVVSDIEPGDHFYPFYTGVKKELSKIIGGTDANISDFPWQVYYESGNYLCGGTIISDSWIITAAHCTKNEDASDIPVSQMFVKAGATNPYRINEGKKYLISDVILHESFNNQTLDNDIALLKLKVPVDIPDAKPIKLVTAADAEEGATDPGVISWVTGWGLTDVSPEILPYNLQKVQLPIVSREQAATVWRSITGNVIMAGYRNGPQDACNGDSGGPLVVPVSGEYRLAGITSWGSEDCDTYSAYTRVSAYENWIRTKTGITEYTPPVPTGNHLICQGTNFTGYSISPLPGVSEYQWELFPENAGTINGTSFSSTVAWDHDYLGNATVKLRVISDGKLSEWSRLDVEVVMNTKIISQPADMVLCAGQTIDLNISAEGHDLKYYRYKDDVLTNTLTSGNYNIAGASTANSGLYRCTIAGSCGTLYTNNINVTVHPLTRINNFSQDISVDSGDDAVLEVIAEGHSLTYQWIRNNEILNNSDKSRLELNNTDASVIGLYQAIVKGTCGTEMSSKTYLYVRQEETPGYPDILVWPTVTDGVINTALSTDEIYSVRIFSYTGKIIMDTKNCRYQTIIDMNNYPAGNYIISVYNRKFRWNQKFIKQ